MFSNFDFDVIARSWPYLFKDGMSFTLMLTALATGAGIVLGTLLALMRLSKFIVLQKFAETYVNIIRSLPLVLVIFWFYFLLPYIGQWVLGSERPMAVGAFMSALVTFSLFEAAYFSEIMRAGIQAVPRGQVAAAQALGMRYHQVMGYIVLPQAFRAMTPLLLTQSIILFQDTSLVYVLSLTDFLGAASKVAQRDGRLVERTLATGASIRNELAPDRQGWEPTARAGLAYEAGIVTLRAAAYLGWRLPTLNELYRPFRVGADATAANPALAPERMNGAELGIDLTPAEGVSLRATAFTNKLTDAIGNVTLAQGPGTFPGVGFVAGAYRQRVNMDAVRSNGVELDARIERGDWRLAASYAYSDARISGSGRAAALDGLRPAQVPAHTGSGTLGWRGLSTTLRYVSAQFEDDSNSRRLNDALTVDAVAVVPVTDRMSLFVRGENVTNARVETAISATGVIERAAPRTIWIGLRLN